MAANTEGPTTMANEVKEVEDINMDDLIKGFEDEIETLKAMNETLKVERDRFADERDQLQSEIKEFKGESRDRRHRERTLEERLAAAEAERDEFALGIQETEERLGARTKEIEDQLDQFRLQAEEKTKELRHVKHDRSYEKISKRLGVNTDDTVLYKDFLKLASFEPDTDEPDEDRIEEVFSEFLQDRPWLLASNRKMPARKAVAKDDGEPEGGPVQSDGGDIEVRQTGPDGTTHDKAGPGGPKRAPGGALGATRRTTVPDRPVENGRPGAGADRGESVHTGQTTLAGNKHADGRL